MGEAEGVARRRSDRIEEVFWVSQIFSIPADLVVWTKSAT
jgi:hypothetical protein